MAVNVLASAGLGVSRVCSNIELQYRAVVLAEHRANR